MLKHRSSFVMLVVAIVMLLMVGVAYAANTTSVLGGGVAINEILPDPNGTTYNTDTDGNGTADTTDEFVELYNLSMAPIDISGWELWDAGTDLWFTFPGSPGSNTTILAAGAYAHVMVGVQSGGSLPAMTNSNSIAFDAGGGGGVINNGGDNVVLYDPQNDEYIQLRFNDDAADDPTDGANPDYDGFSTTAARVGIVEDWGNDLDGVSLTRSPSGDTNVVQHQSTYGTTASANAITLSSVSATGFNPGMLALALAAILAIGAGAFVLRRRAVL